MNLTHHPDAKSHESSRHRPSCPHGAAEVCHADVVRAGVSRGFVGSPGQTLRNAFIKSLVHGDAVGYIHLCAPGGCVDARAPPITGDRRRLG